MKRSEQPGSGQAELQVAREGREHDPVGDACDADVQADREHRDGQQKNAILACEKHATSPFEGRSSPTVCRTATMKPWAMATTALVRNQR